jgi:ParB family transcriptional regulator, chromosome partitioning protein
MTTTTEVTANGKSEKTEPKKKASGTNTATTYGSQGRSDLLYLDPEKITLVTDDKHPLYDPRVHLPVEDADVQNVMENGIIEPVAVRKNGEEKDGTPIVECVFGRQRVKWACEANKRLKKLGRELIRVPCFVKKGPDDRLFGIIISENEIRHADPPLEKAKKIARYMEMGRSVEDAAIAYGVTTQGIRNFLALLDCDKSVQTAVAKGTITATLAAQQLSKLPREEQKPALEKLIETGVTKGRSAEESVKRIRRDKAAKPSKLKARSFKTIEKARKVLLRLDTRDATFAAAVLKFAQGYDNSLKDWPSIEKALFPKDDE